MPLEVSVMAPLPRVNKNPGIRVITSQTASFVVSGYKNQPPSFMTKCTLLFPSLETLAGFAKAYSSHYLINTCNLTLTGPLSDEVLTVAKTLFGACLVATTENVFSYDAVVVRPPQLLQTI